MHTQKTCACPCWTLAVTLLFSWITKYFTNMLFSWIFISCFLQVPILGCSYGRSECLVRMNYRLEGEGNVLITGLFPAYAVYPLNRTIDWRMTKFNREFMVEYVFFYIYSLCKYDIHIPWEKYRFKPYTTILSFAPLKDFTFLPRSVLWCCLLSDLSDAFKGEISIWVFMFFSTVGTGNMAHTLFHAYDR